MKKIPLLTAALGLSAVVSSLAACGGADVKNGQDASAAAAKPRTACNMVQAGPDGETPTQANTITLSDDEVAKFKALNRPVRVATFWQANGANETLMRQGMADLWQKYGLNVELISQSNANWDAPTQANQILTQLGMKPDAMIGILVDAASERTAIEKVNAAKVPIIFWDVSAGGNTTYNSIVTSNGQQAGCLAADAMATALHGKGDIAVMPMTFAFYPTDQRVEGFVKRIKSEYPGIHIVAKMGATVEQDGIVKGQGLLQRYPNLKGVFASWLDPAMGVVEATRTLGKKDVVVTTVDLADPDAKIIAACGTLKAAATQLPYEEGVAEGQLLVKLLVGAQTPKYVVTDTPIATYDSVFDVYKAVYHQDAPSQIVQARAKSCS